MKKILKSLLVFLLVLPIMIEAKTLESGIKYVNEYIIPFKDYTKYVVTGTKYDLENATLKTNSQFTGGGLISRTEYLLSQKNENYATTYLYDGSKFWTLTKSGANNYYITPDGIKTLAPTQSTGVRVTEYLKNSVMVNGTGSIINPYVFLPEYTITITTNDEQYATLNEVELKKKANGGNEVIVKKTGLAEITQKVFQGNNAYVGIAVKPGYKYINDTCSNEENQLSRIVENNTLFIVSGINKDLNCKINFGVGIYKVGLDRNCPGDQTNKNIGTKEIYLEYNNGWYEDSKANNVIGNIVIPKCEGHTFLGYSYEGTEIINSNGTIVSGKTKTINGPTTLRARWDVNEYNLTINPNGGEYKNKATNTVVKQEYNSQYTLENPTKVPKYTISFQGKGSTNYTVGTQDSNRDFSKWEKVSGNGTLSGNVFTYGSSDAEVRAVYNTSANEVTTPSIKREYTITYNLNGTGATFSKTSDVVAYTMNGWYDAETGGTRVTTNGGKFVPTKNQTLYAQWTANSQRLDAAVKTGYTCNWYNGEVKLENGSNFTPTGDVTLKLKCTANNYVVNITSTSCGTFGQSTITATYDSAMPKLSTVPSKTGYTFNGFYIGDVKYYNADGTSARTWNIASNSTATLTAKCSPITYTVKYSCSPGSGTMPNQTLTYDAPANLQSHSCTRTSYKVVGWTDESGNTYTNNQSVTNLRNTQGATITLTAKWELDTYSIIYNANGGSGSNVTKSHNYNANATIIDNPFTRSGFQFTGWKDGSGNSYSVGQVVRDLAPISTGKITLYAQWKDIQSPTCSLTASSTAVNIAVTDNVGVTQYGIGTSSTANYNGKNTHNLTTGTIYGYVRDAAGNTGSCSATIISTSAVYSCPTGYTNYYNNTKECYKVTEPTEPFCASGYTLSGGQCYKTTTPDSPYCPSGYTLSGTQCLKITEPTDPYCASGYTLSGSQCVKTTSADTPVCPSGYSLSGGQCVKITEADLRVCPSGYFDCMDRNWPICQKASSRNCAKYYGAVTYLYDKTEKVCQVGKRLHQINTCEIKEYSCTRSATAVCPSGYTVYATTSCRKTIAATKTCPSGYKDSGSTCTETNNATKTCPSGYEFNLLKTKCKKEVSATQYCPSGYTLSGGECRKTTTPTKTCPSGYTLSGSTCRETQAATQDDCKTYSYSCSAGTLSGTNCVQSTSYTASCPSGYSYYNSTTCRESQAANQGSCKTYKSCANSSCSCKTYKSCANSACGAATYKSCADSACGCSVYKSCATSACGYKSCAASSCGCSVYKSCAASACGCKTYKSCKTSSCGYASCKASACGCAGCLSSLWKANCTKCGYKSCATSACGYKSCAASSCGCSVYKSCATSSCGCKTYKSCANSSCGYASCAASACGCKTYKTCATSGCGVSTYKSCATSACGCSVYNSCADSSCGCSVYNYSCPILGGWTLSGSTCYRTKDRQFSCPSGYTKGGSGTSTTCTKTTAATKTCTAYNYKCPLLGGWTLSGTTCYRTKDYSLTCPSGYKLEGSTCVATTDVLYKCSTGYTLSGKTCTAEASYYYTCPSGYTVSDDKCVKTTSYNYTCPSGYTKSGTNCYIDATPSSWTCPEGTLSGKVCNLTNSSSKAGWTCTPKYGFRTSIGATGTDDCTAGFTCNAANVGKSYFSACLLDYTVWSPETKTNKTPDCEVSNETCNHKESELGNTVTSCYHPQTDRNYYSCPSGGAIPTTDVATMTNWSCYLYSDYTSTACSSGTQKGTQCYHYANPSGYTCSSGTQSGNTCYHYASYAGYNCTTGTKTNGKCYNYTSISGYRCASGTQSGNLCYHYQNYAGYNCSSGTKVSGKCEHYTTKVVSGYSCPSGYTKLSNSYCIK